MSNRIDKERIHLMSPCATVCAALEIAPAAEEHALRAAIEKVLRAHALLCCRVELDADGEARFVPNGAPVVSLAPFDGDALALIAAQQNRPFAIQRGELARFFFHSEGGRTRLVCAVHHVACDGGSLVRLLRALLLALNGEDVPARPVRLLSPDDLPAHPGLNPLLRLMMKRTNRRWRQTGRAFTADDFAAMQRAYAETHPVRVQLRTLSPDAVSALEHLAHAHNITINSLLTAAFAAAARPGEKLGVAVDVRPRGIDGPGNFATAIGLPAEYDPRTSFLSNAEKIHAAIRGRLESPRERFFLYEFMRALAPTLVDSIYFCRWGGARNPVSEAAAKMCGYTDSPSGLSLSNLKRLDMPDGAPYHCETLYFVPPYIPNVRAVVGISTFRNTLTLTLSAPEPFPETLLEIAAKTLESAIE